MADEDGFLSRWSQRKRSVVEPPRSELDPEPFDDAELEGPGQAENTGSEVQPGTEEESALLEKLGLPVPETLKEGDDFSAFMQAGVPQFLRKRALRILWRSNPVLANLDGLNDYDDDFTSPELTQKVLATGYQVGRGFVKQVTQDDDEVDQPVAEEVAEADQQPELEPTDFKEVSFAEPSDEMLQETDEATVFRPRRMRFET